MIGSSITRRELPLRAASATRNGAKRGELAARQPRADEDAVLGVSSRSSIGAPERVQLGEPAALVVGHEQPDVLEAVAKRSAIRARSSSRPSPVRAEICSASGEAVREPAARERVDARRPC